MNSLESAPAEGGSSPITPELLAEAGGSEELAWRLYFLHMEATRSYRDDRVAKNVMEIALSDVYIYFEKICLEQATDQAAA